MTGATWRLAGKATWRLAERGTYAVCPGVKSGRRSSFFEKWSTKVSFPRVPKAIMFEKVRQNYALHSCFMRTGVYSVFSRGGEGYNEHT